MKQYFTYLNGEQTGPFTFEDLKTKNIYRDTLVWFEGLPDWQKAGTIEELNPLFRAVPPPVRVNHEIKSPAVPPPAYAEQTYQPPIEEYEPRKILGIKRTFFMYGVIAVVLIISISAFSSYKNNAQEETVRNEAYNQQLEEQQAEIEAQNTRIAEQERLEKERVEHEKRIARENRIKELTEQLAIDYQNLEKAKKQLHDATAFQLLRSRSERHEQISAAETSVASWQNEINQLEAELNNLNAG